MASGIIVGYHLLHIILVYTEYSTDHIHCMFWERMPCSDVLNLATGGVLAWVESGNEDWYSATSCHQNSSNLSCAYLSLAV